MFNDTFGQGGGCLSLMVSARSDLQAQQPRLVDEETLHIDLQAMNNGIDKVFAYAVTNTPYQLYPLAESFTDYLIQYIATTKTMDGPDSLAVIDSETGYNDLITALQKSQGLLPISVLLPQAKGWNMDNYLPMYYNWEKQFIIPSIIPT